MADTPKNIDGVAKPSSVRPDATSKPVIVGHKPMVEDPMVSTAAKTAAEKPAEAPAKAPATVAGAKKIEPLSPEMKQDEPASDTSKAPQTEQATSEKEEKPDVEAEAASKEAEKQARLEELIANKEYYVKVQDKRKSSIKTFFITALSIVVVGIVLLVVLVDAGILDVGLQLPFDLIK